MRGSMIMRPETTRPMWLDHPVPFVVAGMKAGTESPEVQVPGGSLSRKTQVIGREDVTVPAGTYKAYKVVTSNNFGEVETRWVAPAAGILVAKRLVTRAATHPQGPGELEAVLLSQVPPAK